MQQNLHHCRVTRVELVEIVQCLQLAKQQLHRPPTTVDRRYIRRQEPPSGQIRDREVVVVGVRNEDADDAEALRIPQPCTCVWAAFERHFDLDIDVLAVEILRNPEDPFVFKRNGAAAPFPQFGDDLGLRGAVESTHEVAAVLVDQREPAALEMR